MSSHSAVIVYTLCSILNLNTAKMKIWHICFFICSFYKAPLRSWLSSGLSFERPSISGCWRCLWLAHRGRVRRPCWRSYRRARPLPSPPQNAAFPPPPGSWTTPTEAKTWGKHKVHKCAAGIGTKGWNPIHKRPTPYEWGISLFPYDV